MTRSLCNSRGSALIAILCLLAGMTIVCISLYSQVASGTQDGSAARGRYLAESTARSCLELALADTLASIASQNPVYQIFKYDSTLFPAVRGRNLSCTVNVSMEGSAIALDATAEAVGSRDRYVARYKNISAP